jgi:peptidyl-prolyl cis-trans isomerase B (cyclophilin B)
MPSGSRKTRERQLAKLAARRAAERHRKRRQRILTIVVALVVAAGGLSFAGVALLKKPGKHPAASGTPTPLVTPSGSPSPSPPAAAVACGGKKPHAASVKKRTYAKPPAMTISTSKSYTATMQTSCGTIVIRLDPKVAPKTVNSMVFLAQHHFYDGLTFHRIVPGFVIQGGDPQGTGSGGPGYTTVDPPPKNAKYPVGAVAMAKTQMEAAGTAGSQFFIVTADTAQDALAPGGTGQYAIVGNVTSGMDVVGKISAVPVADQSTGAPAQTVYIVSVTIKAS